MNDYVSWYALLEKPFFSPEPWVFGFAWGIIYPLIALAFVYLAYDVYRKRAPLWLIGLFIVNMIANFAYTPIQIGLQNNLLAAIDIFIVLVTLIVLVAHAYKYSKWVFALLVPYLAWGTFATVLQWTITWLNW